MKRFLIAAALLFVMSSSASAAPSTLDGAATVKPAGRVVTLAPHLAELVCAAGGCERLVAVTAYSNFPPQVSRLPQLGDAWSLNLEAILAQKPDLILAWDGGNSREAVTRLAKLGLRVQWLKVETLDGVATALEQVGGWLGTPDAGQTAANRYRASLAKLRDAHRNDAPIRVVYQIETSPAYTINGKSPISEALAVCGGINVFKDLPTLSAAVSQEAMLLAAPEAVIYGGEENTSAMQAYWARLKSVPAAKADNLFATDSDRLTRATPRVLDGIDAVCAALATARKRL